MINEAKTKLISILFLHIVLLVYSTGSILSKLAASHAFLSQEFILYYGLVLVISVLYALLWQQVLKRMSLVTAYANKAITVIWGLVWGRLLFHETITLMNIIGSLIIIVGVYFVVAGEEAK